ncbi:hypothetical protein GF402_10895 [Candidatus Fermentibacteria bacterium]|nr:hypothetical protein [Candidatus Fermentibacteria bacterium]
MAKSLTQSYAITLAAGAILLLALSCTYSLTGNLPGHIRSVEVQDFRSAATEYGLDTELTARVTEMLVKDGRLAVTGTQPDSRISGNVSSFSRTAYSYSAAEVVEEYKLTMQVNITFDDLVEEKKLLDGESVREWIVYDPDTESFDQAKERLLEVTSEEIVRKCLSGW